MLKPYWLTELGPQEGGHAQPPLAHTARGLRREDYSWTLLYFSESELHWEDNLSQKLWVAIINLQLPSVPKQQLNTDSSALGNNDPVYSWF